MQSFLRNNLFRSIRNTLNIKPTFSNLPNNENSSVSDFFFWINENGFNTNYQVANLADHATPDLKLDDKVSIYIYDNEGILLKKINTIIKSKSSLSLNFNDINLYGNGSFLVFHDFMSKEILSKNNTFISDRGYVGYNRYNGIWNYVHGNNYSCSFDGNKIYSLLTKSFFNNFYQPQISFNDCDSFEIILNNPSYQKHNYIINTLDNNLKLIDKTNHVLMPFSSIKKRFSNNLINSIKISSKFNLNRPLIIKYYKSYFDILHA